jgi:hypothetical protein
MSLRPSRPVDEASLDEMFVFVEMLVAPSRPKDAGQALRWKAKKFENRLLGPTNTNRALLSEIYKQTHSALLTRYKTVGSPFCDT